MNRRNFLSWLGVGTLASSVPLIIVACSNFENEDTRLSTELESNATAATTEDFFMVGIASELERDGFILNEDIAGNPVMVFRHPETRELIAFNPQCTHQQCNVEINTNRNILVCPCHDSHFAFDGKVLKNPATRPLDFYQVKQEQYLILVKIS